MATGSFEFQPVTITLPTSTPQGTTIKVSGGSPFTHHNPKPKGIRAVKLTESNRDQIAAHFRKIYEADDSGIKDVVVTNDRIRLVRDTENIIYGLHDQTFRLGSWIEEKYDYDRGLTIFGHVSGWDRAAHDLR